ncbi:MAG: DUF4360 domain-containing protein [Bauldia sp.]
MKRIVLAAALLIAGIGAAHAQAGLRLGTPTYGGTGCPQGTASAVLSSDGQSLSIFYDQYRAATGNGRSFDRKSCNLAIPLDVPSGYSVSVLTVDYRGFNQLPAGASSVFTVEYFFAGGQGPRFTRTFNGPRTQDFFIRNELTAASTVWSACGQDVILRTNSSVRVTAPGGRAAEATVDTEDIAAALVYRLQWRRC